MSSEDLDLTLAQSGTDLHASRAASEDAPPVPPDVPGYRLENLLGRGSFGEVWAGTQTRSGLRVAVKVLTRREGLDWLYFKHEVGRLREVAEHPNVVSLIDADLNHDPPYFVMPLLSRGSLHEAEQPTFEQAIRWLEEIARALRFCHEKGLLHCDLKPSNVMLDEEGHVRLVDYGQSRSKQDRTVTWGTLGFMAPEQAVLGGDSLPSTRWDIYSLGATAYYLLTGRCPRLSESDRTELTRTEDTTRRLAQYRELLRTRPLIPLRKLNSRVDRDLAAIIQSCLELESERRTDSADEFLSDLERRRTGDPLMCDQPWSTPYRLQRLLKKPSVLMFLAFVLLLLASLTWAGVTVHRATMAQFQYDGGVVAEERGDLQTAYLHWAAALRDVPLLLPGKRATWSVRFNTRLPWVLERRYAPPTPDMAGTTLAFSPDGETLAAGYEDGRTLLVDLKSGATRPGPTLPGRVTRLELDEAGKLLALSPTELTYDGQLEKGPFTPAVTRTKAGYAIGLEDGRVLELPANKRVKTGSDSPVTVLASHQGHLAVAHQDGTLELDGRKLLSQGRVLELAFRDGLLQAEYSDASVVRYDENGRPVSEAEPAEDVQLKAMAGTGEYLARSYENAVRLRRLSDNHLLANLHHEDVVRLIAFSPDGKLVATAAADRTARVWNVDSGSPDSPMLRHGSQLRELRFSPDGKRLATITRLGVLSVWGEAPDSRFVRRLEHPGEVTAMALEGDRLVTGCLDGNLRVYSLSAPSEPRIFPQGSPIVSLALSPGGQTLAATSVDQKLRLWKLANGQPAGELEVGAHVLALDFSPDGRRLALTAGDKVRLVDVQSGQFTGQMLPAHDMIVELKFSPDGRYLAAAGVGEGVVTVWDTESASPLHTFKHPVQVPSVDFSPDSKWLLTSCNDGRARRYDLESGLEMTPPFVEEQPLHAARISPDEHIVAVAGDERSARIFHLDNHAGPLLTHSGPVLALAFNSDGRLVATGSVDGTGRVWDSYSGLPLTTALEHAAGVSHVLFSDDDRTLATLAGQEVCLWNLSPNPANPRELVRQIQRDTGMKLDNHQTRVLTPEAWQKIVP